MNLYEYFCKAAATYPRKIALITQSGNYTYADVLRLQHDFERSLRKNVQGEGRRIAFVSRHIHLYVAMMLTASRFGHRLYLVRRDRLASFGIEFDYTVSDQDLGDQARGRFVHVRPAWFSKNTDTRKSPPRTPKIEAVFVFGTSGSTGAPKLFPKLERDLVHDAEILRSDKGFFGEPETERLYVSPALEMAWAQCKIFGTLMHGGSVFSVIDKQQYIASFIDQFSINSLVLAPAFARQLIDLPDAGNFLTRLRHISIGGAHVSRGLMKAYADTTPTIVSGGFGSSELLRVSHYIYDPLVDNGPGYVGKIARLNVEIAMFSGDLKRLPDATEGILGVKYPGKDMTARYENLSDAENARYFVDGYFITGDIVRVDGENLFLIGRSKNIVNQGGNKYSLEQIEQTITNDLDVSEACAVVKQSAEGGDDLHVFFVATQDIKPDEIAKCLKTRFPGLVVSKTHRIKDLPLGPSGKIQRDVLLARIQ